MKHCQWISWRALACVVLVGVTGGCDPGEKGADAEEGSEAVPVPVRVEVIQNSVIVDRVILPCTAEPYETVRVSAEVTGRVTGMTHEEGEQVKAGEVLFLCDTERLQVEVARAEASHALAEASYKRVEELARSKFGQATAEQLDRARAERDVAKANLESAGIMLERATIRSPLDGYLERRYVDVGEYVNSGSPVADIVQIDKLKVYVEVPERDVSYIGRGSQVLLHFGFNGEGDFPGTIENIDRVADSVTRTYRAKVVMDNSKMLIRPGMIGSTVLVRGKSHEGIGVPLDVVIARKGTRYVVVENGGKAVIREVSIGVFDGQRVEITRGLEVGDRLIVAGQRQVNESDPVTVVPDEKSEGPELTGKPDDSQ